MRVCGAAVWNDTGKDLPLRYARLFLWQRRYAGGVGVALVSDMSDLSDLSDLSDKMSAPVFALTGYAVASHVIP